MQSIFNIITLIIIVMTQATAQNYKHSNHLIHETSPYLLQHAHNPVNWYPWGEEALEKAKEENKLILISIGYSACHWCHVMEHESFENEEIAQLMNEYFVCIKVDREERPDVDQVYMNAVHLMRGQGGWPLNCFALPDGRPVYGATYFPPKQWKETLNSLRLSYQENPQKFVDYANTLLTGVKQSEVISIKKETSVFVEQDIHDVFKNIAQSFDMKEGGFGNAPKFPLPIGLQFCLDYSQVYNNKKAEDFLFLSLDKIAKGGIYDQIGGGFARYSVDGIWKVPHFEKMLYDNAQLVSLYAKAYKLNKSELYKNSIKQTLGFIARELTQEEGGFYSALDADSDGIEGKYYVWSKSEIDEILREKSALFCDYYGITEKGNWEEGNNILMQTEADLAKKYHLDESELLKTISYLNKIVLGKREKRVKPSLDDKIITAWNGLMLKGYIDAYLALGEQEYLLIAEKSADFIWNKLSNKKGKLLRTYKNGHAKIDAFLDDYAITIDAYLTLYQTTLNHQYLERSDLLMQYCQDNFLNTKSQMYYYTQKNNSFLVARKMEISDNVIPASNSIMAQNVLTLGIINSNQNQTEQALVMLQNVKASLSKGQVYYANWDLLLMRILQVSKEVVIMGEEYLNWNRQIQKQYSFNTVFVGSREKEYLPLMKQRYQEGKSLIYFCEDKTCQLPFRSIDDALGIFSKGN